MITGKVYIAGTAMITSLGSGVGRNMDALIAGDSGVKKSSLPRVTQSSLMLGLIPESIYDELDRKYGQSEYTRAELLAISCIDSLKWNLDKRTGLVLASAKGNISLLENAHYSDASKVIDKSLSFGEMSSRIASRFGIGKEDIFVISNACISGVSVVVTARRMILSGKYSQMIVVGVDVQNRFITSGFASFKSLSPELCRPYDESRCGLNLGEACGAMLLTAEKPSFVQSDAASDEVGSVDSGQFVSIDGGAITDDANHISGPSRTGDGLFFAMRKSMSEAGISSSQVDVLQMHGTATAYNDEMESKAVSLAGLENVPAQSLKPYFGHTMGASGVIETIILAEEMKRGVFVGTKGFEKLGVPMPVNVSAENRSIPRSGTVSAVKTASGFGGTNAAVVLSLGSGLTQNTSKDVELKPVRIVEISNGRISVDGKVVFQADSTDFQIFIREAFKSRGESNLKFYKMDDFCKLGYVASAWLLDGIEYGEEECGLILSGKYGCLDTDIKHQEIIDTEGDASASPAVFVYTLPNVVAGEISIRHHIKGENTWFWSEDASMSDIREYARLAAAAQDLKYCIIGHLDFLKGEYFAKFEVLKSIL